MTNGELQIERIVREVMRRLENRGAAADPSIPHDARTGDGGTLTLDGDLVTTAYLHGKLSGVRQLQVGPRAVVTPSVYDLLREREIALLRIQPSKAKPQSLVLCPAHHDASQLVERVRAAQLPYDIQPLDQAMAKPPQAGHRLVCVTPQWAELTCQLSLQWNQPAVALHNLECWHQARAQVDPTVIVINTQSCTVDQQLQLLAEVHTTT